MIYFTADMHFGHIRGIRRYDVGVDANNFFPISVRQIIDFFDGAE